MIETQSSSSEVTQPRPFDPSQPRCRTHRGAPAGPTVAECGACAGAAEWVLRRCAMCDGSGQRWDPATHIPVSPYRVCDHVTAHASVVAEVEAAERARDAAAARPRPVVPVPSTVAGRRRARALFRPRKVGPSIPVQRRGPGDPVAREEARRELVGAAAGPAVKGGLDGAPVDVAETVSAGSR